jgi:hypothetical protein
VASPLHVSFNTALSTEQQAVPLFAMQQSSQKPICGFYERVPRSAGHLYLFINVIITITTTTINVNPIKIGPI